MGEYYLFTACAFLNTFCPHRDITVAKYNAGFHRVQAYLALESMWDMPMNKGPSLHQQAGWGDLFQWPQIALCFLNWQTWAGWDKNDMQLPLAGPTQVDHISAGKWSLILYSACECTTLAHSLQEKKTKLCPCICLRHTANSWIWVPVYLKGFYV